MVLRHFLPLVAFGFLLAGCPETDPDSYLGPESPCADLSTPQGYVDALKCPEDQSCVFDPSCTCTEPAKPYQCPALQPWAAMTHGDACGDFDGTTFPTPATGACSASAPSASALDKTGLDPTIAGRWHLPDGHFIQPAGHDQIVHGADVASAFLVDEVLVPGTRFAVLVDAGVEDNALYTVDLDLLAQDAPALVSESRFAAPSEVDYGIVFAAPNEIYVSGAANGLIYAFTIDMTSGALARDPSHDVDLGAASDPNAPSRWYAGGIATTADPTKLVVAPSTGESQVRLVDLAAKTWSSIDVSPSRELFGIFPDPNDAAQHGYYVTALDTREVIRVDTSSGAVTARYPTGKNPEGVAVTAQHVLVANSDDDTIDVYDSTGKVLQTLTVGSDGLTGTQPSVLAYDPNLQRVYAALSGINAIDVYSYDSSATKPLSPLGRIPTSWWPTAIRIRADGSLVVTSAKGHGTGPATGTLTTPDLTKGAVALIPAPTLDDLSTMSVTVVASRQANPLGGFPTVTCSGKTYDFPIPLTNVGAPSTEIQHVVYVVRENKTFDSVFGDLPGVDGDPSNVLSPGRMDEIWANFRALAKGFTNFDDYGIDAEQSLQGHIWTSFGRSTDYIERVWSPTWGRNVRLPRAGIDPVFGSPAEGSIFNWADRNQIPYQDMGEVVGLGPQGFDEEYPGLVYSQLVPDTEKACYIAARARALCDLRALTYVVLPNDHTYGDDPGKPTAELMIAVNDVATGMIADALSHSPMWPSTLLIVTEDDPQTGEDHVDAHRTPLVMISPWVKRGYVSHTEIGTASIHKLLAHIFAKPYQSESVADAALPYDAFTSKPDYTPYTYTALQTPVACNPAKDTIGPPGPDQGTIGPQRDWSMPDQVPELGREVEHRLKLISKVGSEGAVVRPTR
ncbi:MAG TPA: alkaline phosphatase family protein [Polyangiaceae bacterium]|jgi:DNA-binding beta-propeller fold protein YncE